MKIFFCSNENFLEEIRLKYGVWSDIPAGHYQHLQWTIRIGPCKPGSAPVVMLWLLLLLLAGEVTAINILIGNE
ncbi:hypothetical protein MOSE0_L09472, partial [Monosporozyma servazzii]